MVSKKVFKIGVLPGDGIGPEITAEALKVLKTVEELDGNISLDFTSFPWGCEYYLEHGATMPADGLDTLKKFDALLMGAIGDPRVPDHIGAQTLIFTIRRGFDQYVNLRPVKRLPGAPYPLKEEKAIDMVFVRENVEGEYGDIGGRSYPGTPHEVVMQVSVFTRRETERVMRYAFSLARKRRKKVTSITKSNALKHSMVFWDEVFNAVSKEFPDVEAEHVLVDAMTMFLIRRPESFDVVVASNLFGDILTDLASTLQGGLGFAPGGNVNPEKEFPSMFEPIHGSAPKYKGMNRANPIATIWAAAMMLDHIGLEEWSKRVVDAIAAVVKEGRVRTPDLGGKNTTSEMGDAIAQQLRIIAGKKA